MFRYVAAASIRVYRRLVRRSTHCMQRPGRWGGLGAAKSAHDWPSAGQRSGPRTSVVYPQQQQQPHTNTPKNQAPIGAARPRYATAQATQPQNNTAKDPSAPAKNNTEKARLVAESPREVVGQPAAVVVARTWCAPSFHIDLYRAELSPRNLPVGAAIAIGPPPRKPGSMLGARAQQSLRHTRTYNSHARPPQHQSIARNNLHKAKLSCRPSRAPKQVGAA
jgi:hypothetical protein